MNLVKNEKLENNSHELQFSIDAEAFNAAIAKAFKREAGKYNIPDVYKRQVWTRLRPGATWTTA